MQTVDWDHPTPAQRGTHKYRVYDVTCSACGYTRRLKRTDANKAVANDSCFRCSQRVKGRKGFAATSQRFGRRWAMAHVQRHNEAHPTRPERTMSDILTGFDLSFRREVEVATKARGRRRWSCLLDFMVRHEGIDYAIEVDGVRWHAMPENAARDRRKNRLLKRRGIPLLRVTDTDINEGRAEAMVIAFLRLKRPIDSIQTVHDQEEQIDNTTAPEPASADERLDFAYYFPALFGELARAV